MQTMFSTARSESWEVPSQFNQLGQVFLVQTIWFNLGSRCIQNLEARSLNMNSFRIRQRFALHLTPLPNGHRLVISSSSSSSSSFSFSFSFPSSQKQNALNMFNLHSLLGKKTRNKTLCGRCRVATPLPCHLSLFPWLPGLVN